MYVHVRACMRRTYKDASLRGYLDGHVGVEGYALCADTWMRTPLSVCMRAHMRVHRCVHVRTHVRIRVRVDTPVHV